MLAVQRRERALWSRVHCHGWFQSWLAGITVLHAVGAACVTAQKEEITWQVRETVSSLWSVGGVMGFEVGNVLNIKGLACSAEKAFPCLCAARGGK